jgi:hypothetical protein
LPIEFLGGVGIILIKVGAIIILNNIAKIIGEELVVLINNNHS